MKTTFYSKYLLTQASKFMIFLLISLISKNSYASNDDLNYYLGVYGGVSWPLKKHFIITDGENGIYKDIKANVEKSYMASISLGHKISEGSALEFSLDWKPKYPITINLPDNMGALNTKALAYIGIFNFVYDLAHFSNITPYFLVGTGVANVKIKNQSFSISDINTFNLTQNNKFALAFQFGLGAHYKINNQVSFDVSTRFQGISNIKIKYQKSSNDDSKLIDRITKQHLGVLELMLGFIFDF